MTDFTLDLAEARRICDAATKGPWTARLHSDHPTWPAQIDAPHEAGMASMPPVATMMWMCHASGKEAEDRMVKQTEDDCTFIAYARSALPAALDRIAELEAVRKAAEELLYCMDSWREGGMRLGGPQQAEKDLRTVLALESCAASTGRERSADAFVASLPHNECPSWFTNTMVWSVELHQQAYRFKCKLCGSHVDRPTDKGYSPPPRCEICAAKSSTPGGVGEAPPSSGAGDIEAELQGFAGRFVPPEGRWCDPGYLMGILERFRPIIEARARSTATEKAIREAFVAQEPETPMTDYRDETIRVLAEIVAARMALDMVMDIGNLARHHNAVAQLSNNGYAHGAVKLAELNNAIPRLTAAAEARQKMKEAKA